MSGLGVHAEDEILPPHLAITMITSHGISPVEIAPSSARRVSDRICVARLDWRDGFELDDSHDDIICVHLEWKRADAVDREDASPCLLA